jgi:hypothetical protein
MANLLIAVPVLAANRTTYACQASFAAAIAIPSTMPASSISPAVASMGCRLPRMFYITAPAPTAGTAFTAMKLPRFAGEPRGANACSPRLIDLPVRAQVAFRVILRKDHSCSV